MPLNELRDPRTTKPGAGSQIKMAAGVDLGNGVNATLVITATRNVTNPSLTNSSAQLLAANASGRRYALSVTNNDGAETAYLGFGVAAAVGTGVAIAPGATWSWAGADTVDATAGVGIITNAKLQGAINVIGSGSPSGTLEVVETTA